MQTYSRPLITIFLLFNIFDSNAQAFRYPVINTYGYAIKDFAPAGWRILDSAKGDLNTDKIPDAALVLQLIDTFRIAVQEGDTFRTQPRILVVVLKQKQRYKLLLQNNSFILLNDDAAMQDPYSAISIDKGILKVDFYEFCNLGCWYTSSTGCKFRYSANEMILIGADRFTIHRATLDYYEYSYNFITGKRKYTQGNYAKKKLKTAWKKDEAYKRKIKLSTLETPFSWNEDEDTNF